MEELKQELNTIKAYCLLAAKNVLCLDDVALLTGLSKSYLYKMTCQKQIPYYRPSGKQIYFDRSEIETWMKQNRVQTQQEAEQMAAAYCIRKGGAR